MEFFFSLIAKSKERNFNRASDLPPFEMGVLINIFLSWELVCVPSQQLENWRFN